MPKHTDCNLLEKVAWVDEAVSALDIGTSPLSCYLIQGGFIHATNGRMVAAAPFPFDLEGSYLVPAEAFAKVLKNRPDGDFEWLTEVSAHHEQPVLVLKRGRFKGKIKTLPPAEWVFPVEPPATDPIPEGFCDAVKTMLPFCSENATKPWATCLLIMGNHFWASNNVVVARAFCEDLRQPDGEEFMLPRWAAEFVTKRSEGLDGWERGETFCAFEWADGSWMRTSLINDKFPPVSTILEKYGSDAEGMEITPAWRKAVLRVGKITGDPVVRLREDGVYGAQGELVAVEDDASTPVPEGLTETMWDLRFLEPVMESATHWNPTTYPNPSPFKGPGFDGIILGRREQ